MPALLVRPGQPAATPRPPIAVRPMLRAMSPRLRLLLVPVVPVVLLCALLTAVWLVPPDGRATRQVEDGLKRALATYAAARALNAVISVAQGTEVALEPGGVGVVLAPGQVL